MRRLTSASMPTQHGEFEMIAYGRDSNEYSPHIALVSNKRKFSSNVLVRIHSECITGDLFGSKRCDCGHQLAESMKQIGKKGGVLIYLRQEGRGIGIINKLKAYNLQDKGMDTVEANIALGYGIDERSFQDAIYILKDLNIKSIRLLTNNPKKIDAFDHDEIEVFSREKIIIPPCTENLRYLQTKQDDMGHMLNL